jgi:NADPH:quinone reductase-like Zn-dependent oxidoreductase
MAARLAGAGRIIAIDRHKGRLYLARELGAHDVILGGADPLPAQIKAIVPIGVDYAIDTTGVLSVMRAAIDSLAPRGECGFGYDPAFVPIALRAASGPESSPTFAELDSAQKDALSHRGDALRTLAQTIARDSSILA